MPGIVLARGSAAASPRFWAIRLLGDPAGDALADRDPQLVGRLVDVLADLALHRDRDQVLADEPVDPGVVVVDQLAQLGGDRLADLGHARQPAEPGPELLDRLELGGPGRHPLEVLGGPDRDARLGRQRGDRVELVGRPVVRPVVIDVEQPEQLRAVEERRRAQRVEALLDDGGPDVLAARVVAVVDREERSARGDRRGRERAVREARGRSSRYAADRPRLTSADAGRRHAGGRRRRDRPRTGPSRGRPGRTGSGRGRAGCRCRSRRGAGPRRDGAGGRPRRRAGRRDDRADAVGERPGRCRGRAGRATPAASPTT